MESAYKQPSLFISHGTSYEASKNKELKNDFQIIRNKHLKTLPDTIVVFSGHWQTEILSVTTNELMVEIDEGLPSESNIKYSTSGNPNLANTILGLLKIKGINAKADNKRGLDHGAIIPLRLLFPSERIPVIQISQQINLVPNFHKQVAEAIKSIREENVLFISSGGLVHNISKIVPFAGHDLIPDLWAKEFDEFITTELSDKIDVNYSNKIIEAYSHTHFKMSHPTTEHYLPLVFASSLGGSPIKIYESFQWKNLSMSTYKFV
jgi:4,5-DOPA dioxygenase extradiol